MSFPLKSRLQRSLLMRLLQTTGLSLGLIIASIIGVRADDIEADTEIGATGFEGFGDGYGDIPAGPGGPAFAGATANSGTGNATATATATGGEGGTSLGENDDSPGGDAVATSTAKATGFGDATSTANATGGIYGYGGGGGGGGRGGNANAAADASATSGGKAIATAVALEGMSNGGFTTVFNPITANATSSAETTNGARAEAVSTTSGELGEAQSTARTSLGGVSVQSTVMAPSTSSYFVGGTTTSAIAQGGSAPFPSAQPFAISTVLTDKTYATTLIDQIGASNVADALLSPQDQIFGTASQFAFSFTPLGKEIPGTATSTFDFSFRGDLLLGMIDGGFGFDLDIMVNGTEVFAGDSVADTVINLGSNFGPNIDLTISGFGDFVIGGVVSEAVPEPSTWAMMLLGFAGLGFVGYRSTGRARRSLRSFSDQKAVH